MAADKMKLKIREGGFELWAQGTTRATVVVSNGLDETNRVTVSLMTVCGSKALLSAHRYFNVLAEAKRKADALR